MLDLPETLMQFGSGKFLRAFADFFIHEANQSGQGVGRVVVVQSTEHTRADLLNRGHGRYHVLVRGLKDGKTIDDVVPVESVRRALVAARDWQEILAVARSPDLRGIISNTAEVGYQLDPADGPDTVPPHSFPAKLLAVLRARFDAGLPGLTILPCELFEGNADILRGLLLQLADQWKLPEHLQHWISEKCRWHNTLVDRIVTIPEAHPLKSEDPLLTAAEPFALWAVEVKGNDADLFTHWAIHQTSDVRPFFLRKVRILNAAHTAVVGKAGAKGIATVREAVTDPEIEAWLKRLLFEEIIPTLEGRVEAPRQFADQVLERFRNPYLVHKISDIAQYHAEKVAIRLKTTRAEFVEQFGRTPKLLDEAIASGG
jgi:tagaturonate reductase